MTEKEKNLVNLYGITIEQNTVYYYMGHKYERLNDALNYARVHTEHAAAETKLESITSNQDNS